MRKIKNFISYFKILSFEYALLFILSEIFRRLFSNKIHYSYSQFCEDLVLQHLLIGKKNGVYVDVGCNHPIHGNNTFLFYVKGWTGINIDGNKSLIQKYWKHRPLDISVDAIVSDEVKDVNFIIAADDRLSSIEKDFINSKKDEFDYSNLKSQNYRSVTLTNILDKNLLSRNVIDLLTIDVEGHDLAVLRSLDFNKYLPAVITIEMHDCTIETVYNNEINIYLQSKGYKLVYFSLFNGYFVHPQYDWINKINL